MIFLITILGFSSIKSQDVLAGLQNVVPLEVYRLISKTVGEVFHNKSIKLLSFGIISAIWVASNGILALIKALNKAYDEEERRSFIKVQLVAIGFTFALAFMIAVAFVLLIFGKINSTVFLKYFALKSLSPIIWNILRYVIILFVMIFIFSALYHYTPCRKLTWKEVLPGSIFATIGWGVFSELFSLYINNFGNYSKIYGSIGAVIIFMTWLFMISVILLVGGEINATLALCKECN